MKHLPPDEDELEPDSDSLGLAQVRPFDEPVVADVEGQQLRARVESKLFQRDLQPQRLGRWTILEHVGSGGMGVVYAAYDPRLDRRVALKVLRAGRGRRDDAHARVLREAQALARISDPHVVQVHDVEELEDNICLVMELIEGTTMKQWQAEPRTRREIIERYVEVAHGLAKIHEAGLVHRDVKPDNILVADNRVVIADFGLVSLEEGALADRPGIRGAEPTPLERSLTEDEMLVGTLGYMAPEQLERGTVGPRADQFGFFVSLYEALTERRPFRGRNPDVLLGAMIAGPPARGSRGMALPKWLYRIICRGLAFAPEERFGDMAEVEGVISRGLGRGARARTLSLLVGGLGAAAWLGLGREPEEPCLEPPGDFVTVWGDERRFELRGRAARSTDPIRAEAWRHLGTAFDAATEQWASSWQAACYERLQPTSTAEDRRLSVARVACVNDVEARLDGFGVEIFGGPEPGPEAVRQLAVELGRLPNCNDPRVLVEYQMLLGLEEEPAEAQELREELGAAHAREIMNDYSAALHRAEAIEVKARAPGLERIRAEALYRRGRSLADLGRFREAQESLEEAVRISSSTHDHGLTAMASIYLAKLLADDPLGGRGGRGWLLLASNELHGGLGNESQGWLHAELLDAKGIVEHASRDYPRAEQFHRQALELRRRFAPDDDDPDVIRSKNNLANVLSRLGPDRKAEAISLYQDARRSVVRMYGEDHPLNTELWINIGIQHRDAGDLQKAAEAFQRAARIDRDTRGSKGVPALRALVLLGTAAADLGDEETLDATVEQIEEIHQRLMTTEPDAMNRIDRVNELKLIAQARADEDVPAAVEALQRAAAVLEPLDPVEHAWTLIDLAKLSAARERYEEARALLQRALVFLRGHHDPVDDLSLEEAEALLETLDG